ncbi:MAG: hypothetical protein ABFC91_07565 [Methanobacteriaceae archaeon]
MGFPSQLITCELVGSTLPRPHPGLYTGEVKFKTPVFGEGHIIVGDTGNHRTPNKD